MAKKELSCMMMFEFCEPTFWLYEEKAPGGWTNKNRTSSGVIIPLLQLFLKIESSIMDAWRANLQNPILDSQPLANPNENAKSTLVSIVGFSLFTIILGSVWGTLSTNGETVAYSCFQKIFYVAWTAKFYPQLYMNFKRKTTTGLSLDSLYFSLVGYSCFAIYSACTFYEVQVFGQVANHNTSLAVFELLLLFHAAIVSAILVAQKYYYDGYYLSTHRGRNSLSRTTNLILTCYFSLNTLYLTLVGIHISVRAIAVSFNEWIISLVYSAVIFIALRWVPQFFKIRYDKSFKGLSLSSVVLEDIGAFALLVSVAVSSNDGAGTNTPKPFVIKIHFVILNFSNVPLLLAVVVFFGVTMIYLISSFLQFNFLT